MSNQCLAVITARGGSKRIPQKNIKSFLGFPIIKYSIEAALDAGCFDEVMVSTDDKKIAEVALSYGAKVPFFRSEATSDDYAITADVIKEVLLEYKKIGKNFKYCCCIYPTAPFISAEKLAEGYRALMSTDADSVIPVARFSYPIQRALKTVNGKLEMVWPENMNLRSQDLMPTYQDCGQFYWIKTDSFFKQNKLFMEHTVPVEIPEYAVQDIDTEEDWKIAELKYKILNQKY